MPGDSNEESSSSHHASHNSRTPPLCARCRYHGLRSELKGHKRSCPYLNCECLSCSMVVQHQRVMAEHIAIKRAEEKCPASFAYSDIDRSNCSSRFNLQSAGFTHSISPVSGPYQRGEMEHSPNGSSPYPASSTATLMDLSHKLSEHFNYPWEMMPLLYVIMKHSNGDVDQARFELLEAQDIVRQYARDNNLNHF